MNKPELYPNEKIKDIEGFELLYSITSFGRVWSKAKINGYHKGKMLHNGKWIKSFFNKKNGYYSVVFKINGKATSKYIHRLVAKAFISNPDNKKCINHKNCIKKINTVENLEWCTHKENNIHAWENGLKENARHNKLNLEQALEVKRIKKTGLSNLNISKIFSVSENAIRGIVTGKTYKWVNGG